jgi:hypothetical protein
VGALTSPLREDGYWQFVPDDALYDPARAALKIYGGAPPATVPPVTLPAVAPRPPGWSFPDVALLLGALRHLPAHSRIILMFVPYHVVTYATEGDWPRYYYCKEAILTAARALGNAVIVDFMFPNDVTRDYRQYWDGLHYRVGVAGRVAEALRRAKMNEGTEGFAHILLDTQKVERKRQ